MLEILLLSGDSEKPQMLSEVFRRSAHRLETSIRVVGKWEDALEILRDGGRNPETLRANLILIDLGLPRMGGFAVLEELKLDDTLREIPVVVISQDNYENTLLLATQLAAHQFIVVSDNIQSYTNLAESIGEIITQTDVVAD